MDKILTKQMIRIFFFLLFFPISLCLSAQGNLDSTLVNWNLETINSIKRQQEIGQDSNLNNIYRNRLEAFYALNRIDSGNDINRESLRYKFLLELMQYNDISHECLYVIEARFNGSVVHFKNYVLAKGLDKAYRLIVYKYEKGNWSKEGFCFVKYFGSSKPLTNYNISYPKGINDEDMIISKFVNSRVSEAEFYLNKTLQMEDLVTSIFDCYTKGKFVPFNNNN